MKSRNRSVDDALACRCGTTIASAASQGRGWVLGVSIESPKRLRPALPDRHTSGHQCPWPDGTLSPPQISAGHPGGALAASPQEAWALASCRKETYAIVITQQTQDKTKSGIILYICINTVRRRSARRACSAFASSRFAFCLIFFCRHKRWVRTEKLIKKIKNRIDCTCARKQRSSSDFCWLQAPKNFASGCSEWQACRARITSVQCLLRDNESGGCMLFCLRGHDATSATGVAQVTGHRKEKLIVAFADLLR